MWLVNRAQVPCGNEFQAGLEKKKAPRWFILFLSNKPGKPGELR